ncbi:unnamed protein product [Rhizoctonia solani]|uniref:Uncharacterized protein n=1 Tax=Rhizoctonia solani TaxID=456999 RepID=A0A8H3CCL3_9AGAM|nr:unnamed protein product [Rhizoctonia solani]
MPSPRFTISYLYTPLDYKGLQRVVRAQVVYATPPGAHRIVTATHYNCHSSQSAVYGAPSGAYPMVIFVLHNCQ